MRPTVAAARSERGCGSCAVTLPVPASAPRDCTVAKVVGEPPPNTNDVVPICAPAASWTMAGREPPAVTVPLVVSSQDVVPSDEPAGERPPRIRSFPPTAVSASRETAAPSCHGSIPASSEGVPDAAVPTWLVAEATEVVVLAEAEPVVVVVVPGRRRGAPRRQDDHQSRHQEDAEAQHDGSALSDLGLPLPTAGAARRGGAHGRSGVRRRAVRTPSQVLAASPWSRHPPVGLDVDGQCTAPRP